jgi:hypothetical protein
MMSLKVFLAFCILGIDFMIYAFFQWTYGDKRCTLARQITAHKKALKEKSQRPYLVPSQRAPLGIQERSHSVGGRVAKSEPRDPCPSGAYNERLA